jgi:Guanylate-binding protein, N-terminal domain
MAHVHVYGNPLSIVKFNGSVEVEFDKAGLEGLLLHPEVRTRKVVVLSIVGAFRKGKSFFLDYCLRFLYGHVS